MSIRMSSKMMDHVMNSVAEMLPFSDLLYRQLIGCLLLSCLLPCSGYRCRLPSDWRGRYFESGSGDVIIRVRSISTKGTCVEQGQGYFLFDNRKNSCFQCLQFHHRHHNILQYKESHCVAPESLKKVCSQIRSDTPLSTLVRVPPVPVVCPMQGAYSFNYNDLTFGFCARPASYARPCSNGTIYQLQFRHCVTEASLSGTDVDLECVANWTDGHENYLFGRMVGISSHSSKDDAYRCFKYQTSMNEVHLSMSADATCRGLRSFKDGPLVAEMTRDSFAWPTPSCMFPDWLNGATWRDLDGTSRFNLDDSGEVFSEFHRRPGSRSALLEHPTAVFRCIQILDYYRLEEEFIILSFSSLRCLSQLQCLKLRRRANSVIEFYPGSLIDYGYQGQCLHEKEFNWMRILIPNTIVNRKRDEGVDIEMGKNALTEDHRLTPCPRSGLHHTALQGGCLHRLDVGCHNDSIIYIETTCGDQITGVSLECLVVWSKNEKAYVIARDQNTDVMTCFSFRNDKDSSVLFGIEESCNKHLSSRDSYSREPSSSYFIISDEYCSTAVHDLLPVMGSGTQTPTTLRGVTTSTHETSNTDDDDLNLDLELGYDLDDYETEYDQLTEATSAPTLGTPFTGTFNHGHGHLAAGKDLLLAHYANNISGHFTRGFGVLSEGKGSRRAPEGLSDKSEFLEGNDESGFRTDRVRHDSSVRRILTGGVVGSAGHNGGRELAVCLLCLELIR